jgi:hypothetical protein
VRAGLGAGAVWFGGGAGGGLVAHRLFADQLDLAGFGEFVQVE